MDVTPADGRVLVAQRPNATIRQRPPLADVDVRGLRRRANIEVRLECASRRQMKLKE